MPPAGQLPERNDRGLHRRGSPWGHPDPRERRGEVHREQEDRFRGGTAEVGCSRRRRSPPSPTVKGTDWAWTPVDRFVLAKQKETGTQPVKDAEPVVWLRRVSFDLVGLPPTAEQIAAIERDSSRPGPRAESSTNCSLRRSTASAGAGTGWTSPDTPRAPARSGTSSIPRPGGTATGSSTPSTRTSRTTNSSRSRSPATCCPPTPAERDAHVIATGFLALGPKGINERNRESYLLDIADEQIENVSRAVLGLSVGCARCHDHKFDPVTMGDYYSLAGIFRSTDARVGITNRQQNAGQPELSRRAYRPRGLRSRAWPTRGSSTAIKKVERERQARLDALRRRGSRLRPRCWRPWPRSRPINRICSRCCRTAGPTATS